MELERMALVMAAYSFQVVWYPGEVRQKDEHNGRI